MIFQRARRMLLETMIYVSPIAEVAGMYGIIKGGVECSDLYQVVSNSQFIMGAAVYLAGRAAGSLSNRLLNRAVVRENQAKLNEARERASMEMEMARQRAEARALRMSGKKA